jgi:predicted dehydrogenase
MANSHAEAEDMLSAFEAAGQPLFVAYYRRSLPRFQRIRDWVHEGLIGESRHVHWTLMRPPSAQDLAGEKLWRTDPHEAPGGYFDDLACHGLDLLDFILGPIQEASGIRSNQQGLYAVPDAVAGTWRHRDGAQGTGCWNFGAHHSYDRAMIIGSAGRIEFSVFDEAPISLETRSISTAVEIPNPDPIQLYHVESMVRHLSGEERHSSMGASAARTAMVVDRLRSETAAYRSPSLKKAW